MENLYIKKRTLTPDSVNIAYRLYRWKRNVPMVVFVHGLFGSAMLFDLIASFLSKRWIPSIAIDLRGFGQSEYKNLGLNTFSNDLLHILKEEHLVQEVSGTYRCSRPIILVGYSMGTLVTSLLKKRITESDNGTQAMVASLPKNQSEHEDDIILFHISPIVSIKKRWILRNFPLPNVADIALEFLSHPLVFLHLIWEILSARRFIDLAGYVLTGKWDFCFYSEWMNIESLPYTLRVFEEEWHFLLYRVPEALANYLLYLVLWKVELVTTTQEAYIS